MSQKATCPPVTVNLDEVVEAVKKNILDEQPAMGKVARVDADVHSIGIRGLGEIRLLEHTLSPGNFVLGFVTIPSVINLATKLMQVGIIFPQVDLALSRGIFSAVTLVGTLLSGGKSFLLGAFLGQFPSTIDAIADMAVVAIASGKGVVVNPRIDLHGLGATPEEELVKLRNDLRKLQGIGRANADMGDTNRAGTRFIH
jgi:hypothetical protein